MSSTYVIKVLRAAWVDACRSATCISGYQVLVVFASSGATIAIARCMSVCPSVLKITNERIDRYEPNLVGMCSEQSLENADISVLDEDIRIV